MIPDTLIAARTVVPHAEDLINRPRLLDRVAPAAGAPLTLLAAPAGAGKTALVSDWVRSGRAPGPVGWVSLDDGRLDRQDFWRVVDHALPTGETGRRAATLESFAGRVARARRPTVLVLDDFHAVEDPEVLEDVGHLLERPPPGLRLVVLTRRDPPLRLSRLRLNGAVTEIRADDLAFTSDEVEQVVGRQAPELTRQDLHTLWRRTEGWVAAVRLAELTLRHHPRPAAFVRELAGDASIADYIFTEVLGRFPEPVRTFMLQTSVVDVVCGDLADALTGSSGGAAMLRRLTRENAMVLPVARAPGWLRYHPLLRDLLRVELRYERGGEVDELHRRAATWLADHGDVLAAVRYAMRAQDWSLAARIFADGWVEFLLAGDMGQVGDLVGRLGADRLEALPELHVAAAAAALADRDVTGAEAALDRARDRASDVRPGRRTDFRMALATVAHRIHLQAARLELPAAARDAAGTRPALNALELAERGALELWCGAEDRAEANLEASAGMAEQAGVPYVVALATARLALLDALRESFPRAATRAAAALDLIDAGDWRATPAAAAAYAVRAEVSLERDELELAAECVEAALVALAASPEPPLRAYVLGVQAQLLAAAGEGESALRALHYGRREAGGELPGALGRALAAAEASLLDHVGEREQAVARLEQIVDTTPGVEAGGALAELRLAEGRPEEALAILAGLDRAEQHEGVRARVHALGVQALANDALSDHDAAARALERALRLAEPAALRRPLRQLGPGLRPLLNRHVRYGTAHRTLVDELLASLDAPADRRRGPTRLLEPLSDRELAVLRYLPTMMSNHDVGAELFISVNTVKTHLRQIYRKLDVNSRRGAVERARELHLLGPAASARPAEPA